MKKQWGDRAETLTNLVDQGTDRVKFLEASGLLNLHFILHSLYMCLLDIARSVLNCSPK